MTYLLDINVLIALFDMSQIGGHQQITDLCSPSSFRLMLSNLRWASLELSRSRGCSLSEPLLR